MFQMGKTVISRGKGRFFRVKIDFFRKKPVWKTEADTGFKTESTIVPKIDAKKGLKTRTVPSPQRDRRPVKTVTWRKGPEAASNHHYRLMADLSVLSRHFLKFVFEIGAKFRNAFLKPKRLKLA